MRAVLDSSAVLAAVFAEQGAEEVVPLLATSLTPAPQWSEILQKVRSLGHDPRASARRLRGLGLGVKPVAGDDAERAAALWRPNDGLSLADRFCVAVAERLALPCLTADRLWARIGTDAEVVLIR